MTAAAAATVGKYRLVRLLGQGAMGQVYLAQDPFIGRSVAVKLMLSSGEEDEQRFHHEARIVGALAHPNIVVLHDFGFHEGRPYLVMEHVPGLSLQVWMRQPRTLGQQLRVMEGLCSALVYAHRRGVLHRDLKPSNIQVDPEGRCKLMDFGIARAQSLLTATGKVMGTPGYMAPEVVEDAAYSSAADVYSTGVVLYEMLTGENPFVARTVAATLHNVLTARVTGLGVARPDVPEELAGAIMACLTRDPRERPTDLGLLLEVVRRLGGGNGAEIELTPVEIGATRSIQGLPSTRHRRAARRTRVAALLGAAAAVSLAALVGLRWTTAPPAAASPPPVATQPPTAPPTPVPTGPPAVRAAPGARERVASPAANVAVRRAQDLSAPAPGASPTASQRDISAAVPITLESPAPPPSVGSLRAADAPRPTRALGPAPSAALVSLDPRAVRRGATFRLEVRGTGLRPDHRARVLRGRGDATAISVVRQEIASTERGWIVLLVNEDAPLGSYSIALMDGDGRMTNSLGFEVIL